MKHKKKADEQFMATSFIHYGLTYDGETYVFYIGGEQVSREEYIARGGPMLEIGGDHPDGKEFGDETPNNFEPTMPASPYTPVEKG